MHTAAQHPHLLHEVQDIVWPRARGRGGEDEAEALLDEIRARVLEGDTARNRSFWNWEGVGGESQDSVWTPIGRGDAGERTRERDFVMYFHSRQSLDGTMRQGKASRASVGCAGDRDSSSRAGRLA